MMYAAADCFPAKCFFGKYLFLQLEKNSACKTSKTPKKALQPG